MEIKIKRKEATISSDTIEIPAQGSANIPVILENDSSYSNYIKEVHCGYYLNGVYCKIILPIENEKYLIPLEAFESSGPLYLAVALVNVKEIIKTNQINFEVRAAPNGKVILPTENEWHILVKNYMDSLFENDFGDRFDEIGTNLEEMAAEVQTQQEKITSQQTQIDNAIGNMGDYEIVQEDPVQIRFKKGDGTFGETVDLGDGLASKAMVNAGYYTYKGISYDGSASNNGIDVAEIDGAYSQETTNGFQLFDASKLPTKSQGGATVTNNDDGSFTISGSGNLTSNYSNSIVLYSNEEAVKLFKQGTIYLKTEKAITPYFQLIFDGEGSFSLTNNGNSESVGTINQEMLEDVNFRVRLIVYGGSGSTITPATIKPMLYQDGDGTFEPFTGGIASPSPESPQEPKFVGDIGQNLFDASKLPTKSQGGATVTNNGDGSFTISGSGNLSGKFEQRYDYTHEDTLKLLKVGKLKLKKTNWINPVLEIGILNTSTGSWVSGKRMETTGGEQEFDITLDDLNNPNYVLMIRFRGNKDSEIKANIITPMLYQDGDGTYRPFSETPKYYLDFMTSGKNLFNINGNVNVDGYSKEQKTTNTVKDGILTCDVNSARNHGVGQRLCGLKGKTISISAKLKSLGDATIGNIYVYDGSGAYKVVANTQKLETVFAINNYTCQTDDIVVAFAGTGGTGVQFYDIMVNYGAKFVDYEPFTGFETTTVELNPPLRALPNGVKDTIENGIATRRVGEITFDGSEMWYKNSGSNSNNWMYYVTIAHIRAKGLCDSLLHKEIADINSDGARINRVGFNFNHNATVMYLNVGYYMQQAGLTNTVDNLKTWLQSNPITVWYELATPTTEQITLPTLPSWYPYTNAWVGTELQPSFVEWHIKIAGVNQNDLTVIKEDISQLQTETTQLNDDVTKLMGAFTSVTDLTKQLFLLMHRVGDIIFSTSDENPSTIYGGTWVAWGKGQVPVGVDTSDSDFNTVEKTGGEKEHTLTVDEMPSHKHDFGQQFTGMPVSSGNYGYYMIVGTQTDVIKNTGGNQPHNNLQPYITCYMWKRTA